jgi:hypothetical protein
MGLRCKMGLHDWSECRCSSCGKTRDAEHDAHDWSKDCERCARCGATRPAMHDWSKDCGRCARCGATRPAMHDWSEDSARCACCGADKNAQLQLLIGVLKDRGSGSSAFDPRVRAVGGLVSIGLAAVKPLHRVLSSDDSNGEAQRWAACALGEIGDARCVAPLIDILKDRNNRDGELTEIAIAALATIGGAAVEPLRAAIVDASKRGGPGAHWLKDYAGRALSQIEAGVVRPNQYAVILHTGLIGSYRAGRRPHSKT